LSGVVKRCLDGIGGFSKEKLAKGFKVRLVDGGLVFVCKQGGNTGIMEGFVDVSQAMDVCLVDNTTLSLFVAPDFVKWASDVTLNVGDS
jgi:hypothetical protein